jgi:hypothetical protein
MRKPRLRLREFLLLITLASLVTASFAIRTRTASLESAQKHASQAIQERAYVKWWEDVLKEATRKMEQNPQISPEWASRCDLRMMPSVTGIGDLPTEGKDLVIVAELKHTVSNYKDSTADEYSYTTLHFRMFDGQGKIVVEHGEASHLGIGEFKTQLASLWPPHELTEDEKNWVINCVTVFVNDYRNGIATGVEKLKVERAEAIAKAEHHERLARQP